MNPESSARYLRHELIDWLSQDRLAASCTAVIGAGAIGNEVVKNLALLGVGRVDVFDFDTVELHNLTRSIFLRESDVGSDKAEVVAKRAGEVDPNISVQGFAGDFWETLPLRRLASYDCVICAVDNFEARLRLNQLCQIAQVDMVNAAIDSRWITVETFPFSAAATACYECHLPDSAYSRVAERYSCGGLRRRAVAERQVPTTTITASIAGALAASAALRLGDSPAVDARRVFLDTISGSSRVTRLTRRQDCPGCADFESQVRLVHVRNRWNRDDTELPPATAEQVVRLSDALITAYQCAVCGQLEEAARYVNRKAADFDESVAICPSCREPAVQFEIRQSFRMKELMQRFRNDPVPVKYALADMGSGTVCFDLEEDDLND